MLFGSGSGSQPKHKLKTLKKSNTKPNETKTKLSALDLNDEILHQIII
jgi:hypothetical protein